MKRIAVAVSLLLIIVSSFSLAGVSGCMKDVMNSKEYWENKEVTAREDIETLEDGLQTLSENEDAYKDGLRDYEKGVKDLEAGRAQVASGERELAAGEAEYAAGINTIRNAEKSYGGYGVPVLKAAYDNVNKLLAAKKNLTATSAIVAAASGGKVTASQVKDIYNNVNELVKGYSVDKAVATVADASGASASTVKTIYTSVTALIGNGMSTDSAIETVAYNSAKDSVTAAFEGVAGAIQAYGLSVDEAVAIVAEKSGASAATIKSAYTSVAGLMSQGLNKDSAIKKVAVASAKDQVANAFGAVRKLVKGYSKEEAYATVAAKAGSDAASIKQVYSKTVAIYSGLTKNEAYETVGAAAGKSAKEIKEACAGYLSYNSGKKELAKAPDKLNAGRAALADGKAKLADGEKQLADGEKKLAEFEDGREQVIDGMETLINTETYPNITSIKERLGDDYSYMKNKEDIDYDAANTAVAQAKSFLSDTGAVVTSELTGKAYGHFANIAAAVLAILTGLAALIFKKRKNVILGVLGAAVAATGCFAMYQASVAGSAMSEIAGATHLGPMQNMTIIAIIVGTVLCLGINILSDREN